MEKELEQLIEKNIIGIYNAYETTSQDGQFFTEIKEEYLKEQLSMLSQFGWFDALRVKDDIEQNGYNAIVLDHLNQLNNLPFLKICAWYRKKTFELINKYPDDISTVDIPVYRELSGFSVEKEKYDSYQELPDGCKRYIQVIEEFCECPVIAVKMEDDYLLKKPQEKVLSLVKSNKKRK